MKITDKILSIPPYISTSWKNIISLQVESRPFGHALLIELVTGSKVEIPNLDGPVIEQVFLTHATVLEEEDKIKNASLLNTTIIPLPFPNLEGLMPMFAPMLGHNPDQKESPPLPPPMLEKIANMAKDLLSEDASSLKLPEADCNCPHCQITRAILINQGALGAEDGSLTIDEAVSDEDLKFRTWDIQPENDKLYCVTNPLDDKEQYHVFLGNPLGCSCGERNCEHIQAVLKS